MGIITLGFLRASMARGDRSFARRHSLYEGSDLVSDIAYLSDGTIDHRLDIFYPYKPNGCLLLNIHGGTYIYGHKENAAVYCSWFAKQGFTVININYRLLGENGHDTLKVQLEDVVSAITYCHENKERLKLDFQHFGLLGDSAGGQLALLTALLTTSKEARDYFDLALPFIKIKGLALNSPMYDYVELADKGRFYLTKKGLRAMFSAKHEDLSYLQNHSPRYYVNHGAPLPPLFISTSRMDFWRRQPHLLKDDLVRLGLDHVFYDDASRRPRYGHIYNHFLLEDPLGRRLNTAMAVFLRRSLDASEAIIEQETDKTG